MGAWAASAGPARGRRLVDAAAAAIGRTLARCPGRVRTKLVLAFLAIAGLLVVLAWLGLQVLRQSNTRAEHLGALQERVVGYQTLEANAVAFRQLLALCAGGKDYALWLNGGRHAKGNTPACLRRIAQPVRTELVLLGTSTQLGFRPTPAEKPTFRAIETDYARLNTTIEVITRSNFLSLPAHQRAERLAVDLEIAARTLAETAANRAAALVQDNKSAYASSRRLFIGVAAGAVALALLLGFLLAWLVVSPIRRIGSRLAGIAAGDFSARVDLPNRDELGELAANVNRMNDELRRLYRELETASLHKSEFLTNMSHELRTPLNAIMGFSQLLRERLVGDLNERQEEYLDDILGSAEHLLALINDVLDLAKVEAGKVELEIVPFSLRDTLDRGVTMLRERATRNGIDLILDTDPAADSVRGDERRILQVIFNLLANAVKFTRPGGTIEVRSARLDGEIRVSVADSGPGIPAEDQERIFEEFQQAGAGGEQGEGTGLGLALSRRLVELHRGRLWVESEPGRGATFTFALPVTTTAGGRRQLPAAVASGARAEGS
jgi:signal transduction histidine kinase